jgi:hypothetical protein
MRRAFFFLVAVLAGCGGAELSSEGARVQLTGAEAAGCRPLGSLREMEGGGLRSMDTTRAEVQARLRNEAARLGGNALVITSEARGDTDEGALNFETGNAGLTTPNPRCSNCVLMTARVFSCPSQAAPIVARPEAPPAPLPPRVAPLPPPPVYPAPAQAPYPYPPGSTVIIIMPPGAPPPVLPQYPAPQVEPQPEH